MGLGNNMNEHVIEHHIVKYCRDHQILCFKFVSPAHRGVPDRILIGRNGVVAFLEVKKPGKRPTALQNHVMSQILACGILVRWVDNWAAAKQFIDHEVLPRTIPTLGS